MEEKTKVEYISEATITKYLSWNWIYDAVKAAFKASGLDKTIQSPRSVLKLGNTENYLSTSSGYVNDGDNQILACRIITIFPHNRFCGNISNKSNILLLDENTGMLKTVISSTVLNIWATAIRMVVATEHIYRPEEGQQLVVTIVGCGRQGTALAKAFQHFFNMKEVRLYDSQPKTSKTLAANLNSLFSTSIFKAVEYIEDSVRGADVITTSCKPVTPLIKGEWLQKKVMINVMDSLWGEFRELSEDVYSSSDIYVDDIKLVKDSIIERVENFVGDLGSVIAENKLGYRERSIFIATGTAAEVCFIGKKVCDIVHKNWFHDH